MRRYKHLDTFRGLPDPRSQAVSRMDRRQGRWMGPRKQTAREGQSGMCSAIFSVACLVVTNSVTSGGTQAGPTRVLGARGSATNPGGSSKPLAKAGWLPPHPLRVSVYDWCAARAGLRPTPPYRVTGVSKFQSDLKSSLLGTFQGILVPTAHDFCLMHIIRPPFFMAPSVHARVPEVFFTARLILVFRRRGLETSCERL